MVQGCKMAMKSLGQGYSTQPGSVSAGPETDCERVKIAEGKVFPDPRLWPISKAFLR